MASGMSWNDVVVVQYQCSPSVLMLPSAFSFFSPSSFGLKSSVGPTVIIKKDKETNIIEIDCNEEIVCPGTP